MGWEFTLCYPCSVALPDICIFSYSSNQIRKACFQPARAMSSIGMNDKLEPLSKEVIVLFRKSETLLVGMHRGRDGLYHIHPKRPINKNVLLNSSLYRWPRKIWSKVRVSKCQPCDVDPANSFTPRFHWARIRCIPSVLFCPPQYPTGSTSEAERFTFHPK